LVQVDDAALADVEEDADVAAASEEVRECLREKI
jgi:hypothetical protein